MLAQNYTETEVLYVMSKKSNKRAFGSGKKKGYAPLRPLSPEETGRMEAEVIHDLFAYALPINILLDSSIKSECLAEVRELLRDYGKRHILYISKRGFIPEGAERLDYFLFLTREKIGMPLADFLTYIKGTNLDIEGDTAKSIQAKTRILPERMDEAYKAIIRFFRDRLESRHRAKEREWGVFRPSDVTSSTNNYYNFGTINNYSK